MKYIIILLFLLTTSESFSEDSKNKCEIYYQKFLIHRLPYNNIQEFLKNDTYTNKLTLFDQKFIQLIKDYLYFDNFEITENDIDVNIVLEIITKDKVMQIGIDRKFNIIEFNNKKYLLENNYLKYLLMNYLPYKFVIEMKFYNIIWGDL